ncbi:MAG TPA: acyl-CoA dehydrogenase, partial [Flavobacteriales bacterium]|nr:acyl-CoA dehydrogenase [Flavobacteriales bacterium]
EYAVECAILKVYGSEIADFVVDETLQIYGGMGYSEELPIARAYRDSRVNRIYEGTSEINRLLTTGMLLKRAMGGRLDLMGSAIKLQQELMNGTGKSNADFSDEMEEMNHLINNAKKAWLLVAGSAAQTLMAKLEEEQEIMMLIADIAIEIFITESSLLRTRVLIDHHKKEKCEILISMCRVLVAELMENTYRWGREALAGFNKDEVLKMQLAGLKNLTRSKAINLIEERRKIARAFLDEGDYYINRKFKLEVNKKTE